jgi:hypothetical protein
MEGAKIDREVGRRMGYLVHKLALEIYEFFQPRIPALTLVICLSTKVRSTHSSKRPSSSAFWM